MGFEIKKDKTKWIVAGTGQGWELMPRTTEKTVMVLNDFVRKEKYKIQPDYLCMMDVLDEKPQIVSGMDNLGEIIQKINQMRVPFVAPFKYAEIPLSEAFPIEECVKRFGLPYFSNTICYMIAYALMKGAKEIDIYGVNQAGSHEYAEERGGVEYWIGIAIGMGVKVTINGKNSNLLRYKGRYGNGILYGYLQPYEAIVANKKKFGETVFKKLLEPIRPSSETARKVK